MTNKYKKLFEGKFTDTYARRHFSFIEKIGYFVSPATHTERLIYNALNKAVKGKKQLKILDLGCGGGHERLSTYGKIYGIDISKESIKNAKKIYPFVVEGDLTKKLPYASNYFDIVFCSEVFGHIDNEDKDKFLNEMTRVLTFGGFLVMSAETLGNNWMVRLLKKKKLYKKYWVDYQGHIGLLSPSKTVKVIGKYLQVVDAKKTSTWLLSWEGYSIFIEKSVLRDVLYSKIVRILMNVLMSPFYYASSVFSPFDSANDIVIIGQKNDK